MQVDLKLTVLAINLLIVYSVFNDWMSPLNKCHKFSRNAHFKTCSCNELKLINAKVGALKKKPEDHKSFGTRETLDQTKNCLNFTHYTYLHIFSNSLKLEGFKGFNCVGTCMNGHFFKT